jgi:hypothetical protein
MTTPSEGKDGERFRRGMWRKYVLKPIYDNNPLLSLRPDVGIFPS